MICVAEGGAGKVRRQVEIEIDIVGSEHVIRMARDEQKLRAVSVALAGKGANAGKDLNVIAID
jgi:hypothetical protein